MKNIISFVLAIATFGIMASSCSGGTSSPGAAAKQYTRWMGDGQYDKFVDAIYIDPDTPEGVEETRAMLIALIKEKGVESLEENGGLKSVEVLSEEIAEDGQTAEVELRYTYGNGETSDESMDLILSDGKWLIDMDK